MRVLAFPAFRNRKSNPYNALLYESLASSMQNVQVDELSFRRLGFGSYDVIHVHWPELFLNSHYRLKALGFSLLLLGGIWWQRLSGAKLVWTAHNLEAHEVRYRLLSRLFWAAFRRMVDATVSLSHANRTILFSAYARLATVPSLVSYHGLYTTAYPRAMRQVDAKMRLGLPADSIMLLHFGQLKGYKNVDGLIAAFGEFARTRPNANLMIVGRADSDVLTHLSSAANSQISIVNKLVSDDEVSTYFSASDLCVLPYRKVFNSGTLLLAATYRLKTVLPRTQNFEEYQQLLPGGLVHVYSGELVASQLQAALEAEVGGEFSQSLDWKTIGQQHAEFFLSIASPGGQRA